MSRAMILVLLTLSLTAAQPVSVSAPIIPGPVVTVPVAQPTSVVAHVEAPSTNAAEPVAPSTNPKEDVGFLVTALLQAAAAGQWHLVFAAALMLLVLLITRMLPWFKKNDSLKTYVPWITVGLSVATAVSTALFAGAGLATLGLTAAGALAAGLSAVGLWETVGKWVLKRLSPMAKAEDTFKKAAVAAYKAGKLTIDDLKK